jgi:hypothetical protein
MTERTATRHQVTARGWLVGVTVGLVAWPIALSVGQQELAGVAVLIALVSLFGLAWRLLANR